jgi:DNA-binding HxlR family transcriptional regulator
MKSKAKVKTPKVGRPVRGSTTGRPVMVALDLLGRRASLRILWELRVGPLTFRALQEAAATNPSILNTRLRELREAHLVEHGEGGYRLAPEGETLLVAMAPLYAWAEEWGSA